MICLRSSMFLSLITIFIIFSCAETPKSTIADNDDNFVYDFPMQESEKFQVAEVETRLGTMVFWLFDETPNHKAKFIELANEQHYDQFTFNRVVQDFVIQGGCADLPEYFEESPYLLDPEFIDTIGHVYGALGMGRDDNPGKQSNACQFYIVSNEAGVPRLDGDYMIFGEIIHGEAILESIEHEITDETDTPLEAIPLKVSIQEYTADQLFTEFDYSI
ncbi:MAG: peptidyl-prolyl cis-trans isomerase B (cyclophilin B) [Crocinitomix sp.]|jgi:peptidyl-prolyl cis-trans isomerase B (cyclophilin B)